MNNDKLILSVCIVLVLFNTFLIYKNPDCPFHVDYAQYTKSINTFYEEKIIDGNTGLGILMPVWLSLHGQ